MRIRLAIHIYWWHHLLLILRLALLVLVLELMLMLVLLVLVLYHRWMWCVTPRSIWLLHSLRSLYGLHSLHGPRRLRIAPILPCPRIIYLRLICGVLRSTAGALSQVGLRETGGRGGGGVRCLRAEHVLSYRQFD